MKPVKNINFSNGLFVNDALAIQQHLTGINVITDPYRIIACDVGTAATRCRRSTPR
ncbi:MAG: hypothetical protein R3D58_02375 [Saprospiraceae bacterium]